MTASAQTRTIGLTEWPTTWITGIMNSPRASPSALTCKKVEIWLQIFELFYLHLLLDQFRPSTWGLMQKRFARKLNLWLLHLFTKRYIVLVRKVHILFCFKLLNRRNCVPVTFFSKAAGYLPEIHVYSFEMAQMEGCRMYLTYLFNEIWTEYTKVRRHKPPRGDHVPEDNYL